MSVHQPAELFDKARIVAAPVALKRNRGDYTFDLHPGLHAMVVGAYFAFLAILCTAFMGEGLVIPTAICVIGVISLFLTPALWARVQPKDDLRRQSWAEFLDEGVDCYTGHLTSGEAMAQILVLPGMLLGLAAFIAVVGAFV